MDKRAVAAVTTLAALAGITVVAGTAPTTPEPAAAPPAEPPPSTIARWRPLAARAPVRPVLAGQSTIALPTDGAYPVRRLPWSRRSAVADRVTTAFPARTVTGVCTDPDLGPGGDALAAARCGQAMWNNHRLTGAQTWLDQAVVQGEWLLARHRGYGEAWFHPRTVRGTGGRPSIRYSGLVQGEALTLFARLAGTTAQPRWRAAAEGTFAALLVPPRPGRPATGTLRAGRLWLDAEPDPAAALERHIEALTGAYELWRVTADPRALRVVRAALSTVHGVLAADRGLATAALTPHLLYLAELTGRVGFGLAAARAWTGAGGTGGTVLLRGAVPGYVLRGGRPVRAGTVRFSPAARVPLAWRGRVPGSAAVWLRVRGGPLRGRFVPELPGTAYVRGALAPLDLRPTVTVGVRKGTRLLAGGHAGVTAGGTARATARATIDRVATIGGTPCGRLAGGQPHAGRWIALSLVTA
ncbi:hypothetical protein GCM10010123_12630 [Pilimelia anulata]|uniref:Uncharacterized protein n=1 Tax=Pilimelia anulata TaxID=53371 RepID=A0A8J3B8W0_9ACTN|nr:hypothetical protein [Pilimelia anulata]GGJ84452.1 hypothetical protein GCM10010123_12630 [Pilimelia anulata]